MNSYNVWNKWDPLRTVLLGDCFSSDFFRDIKNPRIQSALCQIADETQEDLEYFETVLKNFGCEVLRPVMNKNESIMDYIDPKSGELQNIPTPPLNPRDQQAVLGNELFYCDYFRNIKPKQKVGFPFKEILDKYNPDSVALHGPLTPESWQGYGAGESDWPTYDEYLERFVEGKEFSDIENLHTKIFDIWQNECQFMNIEKFPVHAPQITGVGRDIYYDMYAWREMDDRVKQWYWDKFENHFSKFRHNKVNIGGHNDGAFATLRPGLIITIGFVQDYTETFPGWEIFLVENQSWNRVDGWLQHKNKVQGKWWVPGQEGNDEFTNFVETWLQDWVGYVEETVFDVNCLVLDENTVCVNRMEPKVVDFFNRKKIDVIHVPWRHRYFWDGGLHCITLDLHREGSQQDFFPDRTQSVIDYGY